VVDIPAGLPLRHGEPVREHPRRIHCGHSRVHQLRSSVDPLRVLRTTRTTTSSHDIKILHIMSHAAHSTPRTLQPPITQRDLELEVAQCVGGVTSPLLSNVALSVLDEYIDQAPGGPRATPYQRAKRRRIGLSNYRLIRYADDWCLAVSGSRADAEAMREEIAAVLFTMGLRLSREKTLITHIEDGLDFLGWRIQRHRKRGTSKHFVYLYPAKKALRSVMAKVKKVCWQDVNLPLGTLLHQLNRVLRGWTAYFKHGSSKATFNYLRVYTWKQIWMASPQASTNQLEGTPPQEHPRRMVARHQRGDFV
jgi:hypothetical protein